ncbi:Glutathione S-transferase U17 [Apostasia shenzhenica]|uniref:glutathione transferase n=1 Tax=Apostasia shenzhenica TaxID=1088818 RepID=A0A2I0AFA9_9ASPA|nr:Glutathione S-transferase U17 [Apostasia shenzhenica]
MAAGDELKLIGTWASPFVARPRIAFNLKGIQYEFLQEEFGKKSDLLLKSNPVQKKIPVLIHGGKPVCESLIIVEYIDQIWSSSGPSILPTDPYDRAVARFWAAYVDDKLPLQIRPFIREADEAAKAQAIEQIVAALQHLEEAFEKCSKGKSFFAGDSIGFVDIALGSLIGWLRAVEVLAGVKLFDEERIPGLAKWAERFCSSDAALGIMPETAELVEFSKALRDASRAAAPPSN